MLEKVFYMSVLVSDQDKALDFYTNVLGLEKRVENPTPDGPRFLTVGVKGDEFQLVLWPGTPGQAEPAMGRPPASITIETDDCRKMTEELHRAGSSSSQTWSSSRGATSRSSRTLTATGYSFERAASPVKRNGLTAGHRMSPVAGLYPDEDRAVEHDKDLSPIPHDLEVYAHIEGLVGEENELLEEAEKGRKEEHRERLHAIREELDRAWESAARARRTARQAR